MLYSIERPKEAGYGNRQCGSADVDQGERVRAMGRDPNTFYIHAGKKDPNDRSASQGCIIMEKSVRKSIIELQGAKIRVVR